MFFPDVLETRFLNGQHLFNGDAMEAMESWPAPIVVVCDGPYGIKGYPGDLSFPGALAAWYRPFLEQITEKSTPATTLWFWNTEVGWACVHPVLESLGWKYVACNIWDKGLNHIAGNTNTQTIRHFPVATEVCVQYVREPAFFIKENEKKKQINMQEWLRAEWLRTGLPLSKTNEACGVKNAATRKYFTKDDLWYMPPADVFEKLVGYANEHGNEEGKPYFSVDGRKSISYGELEMIRAKFHCPFGVTNVWHMPPLHSKERLKHGGKAIHNNQKPKELIRRIVEASSDEGDIVWDPFGGLFTTAAVCSDIGRECYSAEVNKDIFEVACTRFAPTSKALLPLPLVASHLCTRKA